MLREGNRHQAEFRKIERVSGGQLGYFMRYNGMSYKEILTILGVKMRNNAKKSALASWTRVTSLVRTQARGAYSRDLNIAQRTTQVPVYLLAKLWYTAQVPVYLLAKLWYTAQVPVYLLAKLWYTAQVPVYLLAKLWYTAQVLQSTSECLRQIVSAVVWYIYGRSPYFGHSCQRCRGEKRTADGI